MEIDEKPFGQDSLDLITKCAMSGTWVLISTLRFPSFWHEAIKKLETLE